MIGLIQHVLLTLLEREGGDALRDAVLRDCGLEPGSRFAIHHDFSDLQCSALITAAVLRTGLDEQALWERYSEVFPGTGAGPVPALFPHGPVRP